MVALPHRTTQYVQEVLGRCKNDPILFAKVFFGVDVTGSPKQMRAITMGGKVQTKAAGRRFGKSLLTTIDRVRDLAIRPKRTGIVTGPSIDQAALYFNELELAADRSPFMEALLDGPVKRSPFPVAKFKNGSLMMGRSVAQNGKFLRGKGADWVAITEAAFIKDRIYNEVIRALVLHTGGTLSLESTPNGDNYFHKLYQLGLHDATGHYRTLHATVYDNKALPVDEIERIKGEVPEYVWLVEYLAQFVADEETVFGWDLLADLFDWDYFPLDQGRPGRRYIIGVDLAQVKDYTAILVVDVTKKPYTLAHWEYYKSRPYTGPDSVTEDVNALRVRFNHAQVLVDATNERGVAEGIIGARGVAFNQQIRTALLSNLQKIARQQALALPASFTRLRDELRFLRRVRRATTVRIDHPDDWFDDCTMALALALWPVHSVESVPQGSGEALQAFAGAILY